MNHSPTHTEPKRKTTKPNVPFFSPTIQKKLSVGSANDSYEVEADHMADRIMRMAEPQLQNATQTGPLLQRKCSACEQEEKLQMKPLADTITPLIQRSSHGESGGHAPSHIESQINGSKGSGSYMDHSTQQFMESRFGTDFSDVKIHTGSQAVQMSRELNAQAFTVGSDIYFNEGKYSPQSDSGKHLLAHELTHTVQQGGNIGRKIQKQATVEDRLTAKCFPNPRGAHLPPMGTSHRLASPMTLLPCNMSEAAVQRSSAWCVDPFQRHRGERCYRRIPSSVGGPSDQFCYSRNCCHNSPDTVSPIDPYLSIGGHLCVPNPSGILGHIWNDVY